MRTSISLEHIAAFLSSRGGVMSPVALRFYDSAIPTPRRSDVARARRYFLGVMIVPRRLASAGAALFCTIVSSAHIPLIIFSPVAQHLPAGTVREARDALVEAICLGSPADE